MKFSLLLLALIVIVATTQESEAFRIRINFRRSSVQLQRMVRDGMRYLSNLFGRRNYRNRQRIEKPTPVVRDEPEVVSAVAAPAPELPTPLAEPKIEESPFKRTIIAIKKETWMGQYVYVRGGGPMGRRIAIKHRIIPEDQDSFFASTSKGDNFLDWGSNEESQGQYEDVVPQGTPMMWTTNDANYHSQIEKHGAGYAKLNVESGHYWLVDIDMNCSQTDNGWFEFKAYLTKDGQTPVHNGWEKNFLKKPCQGKNGPMEFENEDKIANNHVGRCGEFTLVHFEDSTCMIHSMQDIEQWAEDFNGEEPTVVEE